MLDSLLFVLHSVSILLIPPTFFLPDSVNLAVFQFSLFVVDSENTS